MIRKPPADWNRVEESATVRAVRAVSAATKGGARAAERGGQFAQGLICYFSAAAFVFVSIPAMASPPTFILVGAMAAVMVWLGTRAIRKARAPV